MSFGTKGEHFIVIVLVSFFNDLFLSVFPYTLELYAVVVVRQVHAEE